MKKMIFLSFLAILVFSLVLTSCSNEDMAGQAARAVSPEPATMNVNANSCNADETCEVKYLAATKGSFLDGLGVFESLIVNGFMEVKNNDRTLYSTLNPASLVLVENGGYNDWPFIGFHTKSIDNPGYAIGLNKVNNTLVFRSCVNTICENAVTIDKDAQVYTNDNLFVKGYVNANALKTKGIVTVGGDLIVQPAVGTGYAFACFDKNGKLFRSNVACDEI